MTQMIMINTDMTNRIRDCFVPRNNGIKKKSYLIIKKQRHQRSILIFELMETPTKAE